MRVCVRLRFEGGSFRPPFGAGKATSTGDLCLLYVDGQHGRKVPALRLLGAEREIGTLYEPRLVTMLGDEFNFVGYERHENKWVIQQWDCKAI